MVKALVHAARQPVEGDKRDLSGNKKRADVEGASLFIWCGKSRAKGVRGRVSYQENSKGLSEEGSTKQTRLLAKVGFKKGGMRLLGEEEKRAVW